MKGYQINPNKDFVQRIIEGLMRKDGHCPCRKLADDTTLCPCDEFIETGKCKCGLFVPVEDRQSTLDDKNEK